MSVITTTVGISAKLPVERPMPSLGRTNAWLNSEPLSAADLRGKVVLIDFWTYTCINWRRTLPYLRAWARKYQDQGLVVIGFKFDTMPDMEDPLQFAAYSWALVHSSDEDGFAQVLTEAMSMGCPVVTTDSLGGGPRFVTGDGAFGLLVPRNDRMKLAEAMQTMLQPEVRARYAELGLKRSYDMSPTASAIALLNFMSDGLGISA